MKRSQGRGGMGLAHVAVLLALLALPANGAAVPALMNFQGYLTDGAGNPRQGSATMTFRLYPDSTGGATIWTESYAGVAMTDGVFGVALGSALPLPAAAFSGARLWLETVVNDTILAPRRAVISVPYAFRAGVADSAIAVFPGAGSRWNASGADVYRSAGNVGIGAVPTEKLDVAGTLRTSGFKMPTGASSGYVLTSDGGGGGTWMPSAGGLTLPYSGSTFGGTPSFTIGNFGGGTAVAANSGSGNGVYATSTSNSAVSAFSQSSTGVHGSSDTGEGVVGQTSSTAANANALRGVFPVVTPGQNSSAVRGEHLGTGGNGIGVYGSQNGTGWGVLGTAVSGIGVYGSTTDATGVYGTTTSGNGIGVHGYMTSAGTGVVGDSPVGRGVHGASEFGYGLYGTSSGGGAGVVGLASPGPAGQFYGNVNVSGTLFKGAGAFKIDHPLDPENRYLSHSFVESPDMKNIYDGIAALDARGEATVTLPDWFAALNRDVRYQLTAIGAAAPNLHIAEEVRGGRFRIAGGVSGMKVSWQVTGIRQDAYANAHRIPVEEVKVAADRGRYLHPEAFGRPREMAIGWDQSFGRAMPRPPIPTSESGNDVTRVR